MERIQIKIILHCEFAFSKQKNLNISWDFFSSYLLYYNQLSHISNVVVPYIDGTAKHQIIFIIIKIQAITHITIFNHLGIFVFNNIYIHRIKFIMTRIVDGDANDTFFIITNHQIASTE